MGEVTFAYFLLTYDVTLWLNLLKRGFAFSETKAPDGGKG